ncbi:MAG TPA: hypothetical protein VHP99_19380, partial [Pyrinomonadaceae bacterium]|nr:hypothetical protein [Pyrinomonadaceae bacterium]
AAFTRFERLAITAGAAVAAARNSRRDRLIWSGPAERGGDGTLVFSDLDVMSRLTFCSHSFTYANESD